MNVQEYVRKDIVIRSAALSDMESVFALSNDHEVRRNSLKSRRISFNEHKKWFIEKLYDDGIVFLIAEIKDEFVGQIRFNVAGSSAIVSISIVKACRGVGMGQMMMARALCILKKAKPAVNQVNAYVKIGNQASYRFFEKAGFSGAGDMIMSGKRVTLYIYCLKGA